MRLSTWSAVTTQCIEQTNRGSEFPVSICVCVRKHRFHGCNRCDGQGGSVCPFAGFYNIATFVPNLPICVLDFPDLPLKRQ